MKLKDILKGRKMGSKEMAQPKADNKRQSTSLEKLFKKTPYPTQDDKGQLNAFASKPRVVIPQPKKVIKLPSTVKFRVSATSKAMIANITSHSLTGERKQRMLNPRFKPHTSLMDPNFKLSRDLIYYLLDFLDYPSVVFLSLTCKSLYENITLYHLAPTIDESLTVLNTFYSNKIKKGERFPQHLCKECKMWHTFEHMVIWPNHRPEADFRNSYEYKYEQPRRCVRFASRKGGPWTVGCPIGEDHSLCAVCQMPKSNITNKCTWNCDYCGICTNRVDWSPFCQKHVSPSSRAKPSTAPDDELEMPKEIELIREETEQIIEKDARKETETGGLDIMICGSCSKYLFQIPGISRKQLCNCGQAPSSTYELNAPWAKSQPQDSPKPDIEEKVVDSKESTEMINMEDRGVLENKDTIDATETEITEDTSQVTIPNDQEIASTSTEGMVSTTDGSWNISVLGIPLQSGTSESKSMDAPDSKPDNSSSASHLDTVPETTTDNFTTQMTTQEILWSIDKLGIPAIPQTQEPKEIPKHRANSQVLQRPGWGWNFEIVEEKTPTPKKKSPRGTWNFEQWEDSKCKACLGYLYSNPERDNDELCVCLSSISFDNDASLSTPLSAKDEVQQPPSPETQNWFTEATQDTISAQPDGKTCQNCFRKTEVSPFATLDEIGELCICPNIPIVNSFQTEISSATSASPPTPLSGRPVCSTCTKFSTITPGITLFEFMCRCPHGLLPLCPIMPPIRSSARKRNSIFGSLAQNVKIPPSGSLSPRPRCFTCYKFSTFTTGVTLMEAMCRCPHGILPLFPILDSTALPVAIKPTPSYSAEYYKPTIVLTPSSTPLPVAVKPTPSYSAGYYKPTIVLTPSSTPKSASTTTTPDKGTRPYCRNCFLYSTITPGVTLVEQMCKCSHGPLNIQYHIQQDTSGGWLLPGTRSSIGYQPFRKSSTPQPKRKS